MTIDLDQNQQAMLAAELCLIYRALFTDEDLERAVEPACTNPAESAPTSRVGRFTEPC